MVRSTRQARGKQLSAQTRRRLSEEGKRLLRHALAHEEDGAAVDAASVAASRDDESVDSELESVLRFEQEQQIVQQARASRAAAAGKRGARKGRSDDAAAAGVPDLDEAIEELTEKRDTTKIAALRKILSIMCSQVLTDSVDLFRSELTSQAVTCLKRRMKESSPLALRALAVLAITIGADAPDYYEDILTPVQRALTDEGEMAVRIEAAYALSISCFVCCPDEQHAWDVLEVLGGLLMAAREAEDENDDSFPEELVIAVMECWAFLVSAFPAELVASRMDSNSSILSDHMAAIAGFVRDGVNQTVRSAACEVLALLVQLKYVASGDGSDDEDGEGGWSYSDETDGSPIGGLEQKIAAYMRETGKQIGKKNRKQQRSTLKEVLETLRTGEGPHIELQVEDEKLSISTWDRFFQAHVFRRALQSGFQTHMLENSVLRDVFEVTDTAKVSMMSTMRRRADHKSKAIHKRNDVSRKGMAQNAFLYED